MRERIARVILIIRILHFFFVVVNIRVVYDEKTSFNTDGLQSNSYILMSCVNMKIIKKTRF